MLLVEGFFVLVIAFKRSRINEDIAPQCIENEVEIVVDRAKIVSLLTALRMRKLTREQAFELERLLVKERKQCIAEWD